MRQPFYPRERQTTPGADERMQRPDLSIERPLEGLEARGVVFDPEQGARVTEPKAPAAPPAPILCEVDYDVPLLEQFQALERAKCLRLTYVTGDDWRRLQNMQMPSEVGKRHVLLGQETYGSGITTFPDLPTRVPATTAFKSPFHFRAYLNRNRTVGLAYEFACALPCVDGLTWLKVKRYGNARELIVCDGKQQAFTSWYYLVGVDSTP